MTVPSLVSHLRTLATHAVEPLQTETAMHGFLTACALTPEEEVPLADCVEAGFGIPSPEKLPEEARQALEGALDEIRATLHAGNFRFDPPLSVPEGERCFMRCSSSARSVARRRAARLPRQSSACARIPKIPSGSGSVPSFHSSARARKTSSGRCSSSFGFSAAHPAGSVRSAVPIEASGRCVRPATATRCRCW
ncbi:UPF0149 family protein [Thioalkalivibrio nitratireducens]|uniref:UPF0149 family protein n=1 Tax=Thioalkalivibrio nitratireducens TaxID=186931 RepID=UPI003AAECD4B